MSNRSRFLELLEKEYLVLLETPEYAKASLRFTADGLAEKMVNALMRGAADETGKGVKAVCKILGIKNSPIAIAAYLNE